MDDGKHSKHGKPDREPTGQPDPSRRQLTLATAGVGSAGAVAAAVPFSCSFTPSERAKALGAPAVVSIGALADEQRMTVEWRGRPVWILRRSAAQQQRLQARELHERLADPLSHREEQQPAYAANPLRSIQPDVSVLVGLCTHLGCIPLYRPEVGASDLPEGWPGGYFCPCHGSYFDLAGRVFRNVPAPTNLVVPPYRYVSATVIEIGIDPSSRSG